MAMVGSPYIFQIVGYQNSGKTTTITKVIERLTQKGSSVATIKHHGHGGKPDIFEEKDSTRHVMAGAVVSVVEGEGRLLMHAEKEAWSLSEQINLVKQVNTDYIIIEGHKRESYPKVVMIAKKEDIELLSKLNNIIAVCYRNLQLSEITLTEESIDYFSLDDSIGYEELVNLLIRKTQSANDIV